MEAGDYFSELGAGIHVTATNVGNRDVVLNLVCLEMNGQNCLNPQTFMDSKGVLKRGEVTSQYYPISMIEELLRRTDLTNDMKVYGVAGDTEGKKYRKACCTIGDLRKRLVGP